MTQWSPALWMAPKLDHVRRVFISGTGAGLGAGLGVNVS